MFHYLTNLFRGGYPSINSYLRGMAYIIPGAAIPLELMTAEEAAKFDRDAIRSDWLAIFDMGPNSDVFDCLFD